MAIEVKIPPMGESITSGILAKWHVSDGDTVKKDQALFELETDKITSEGTAESAGKISLKVEAGTEVKIGQVVAVIDETAAGSADKKPAKDESSSGEDAKKEKSAKPAPEAEGRAVSAEQSPAVRRIAAESGIDPATVTGTGKGGRVTKSDMISAAEASDQDSGAREKSKDDAKEKDQPKAEAAQRAAPSEAPQGGAKEGRQSRKKMTRLRQTIASRLVAAQHQAAMLTTFNEVDMSAVMDLRKRYQDDFTKRHGVKLGFMSFFTKAAVHALKEVPGVNGYIDGDEIVYNHYYDISMAVSTEKGLMVPVVRNCDTLGMADIEKAIAEAAKKAREGRITLPDLEGGVFTITNGGIFGSMLSTPILNAPQSAILGLHAINERPVAVNGQVVIRPMMYLALSYDHRLVDGKEAVTFLVKVKQAIEDPARLLIGA